MIKIIRGDLLSSGAQYICLQVNCLGVMGSGVANQVKEKWPIVYERYRAACVQYTDDKDKLLGCVQFIPVNNLITVVNIFGQLSYGRDEKCYTDIHALSEACKKIAGKVKLGNTIAMPYRIGCGLAGGDWGKVVDVLTDVFQEHILTLYKV